MYRINGIIIGFFAAVFLAIQLFFSAGMALHRANVKKQIRSSAAEKLSEWIFVPECQHELVITGDEITLNGAKYDVLEIKKTAGGWYLRVIKDHVETGFYTSMGSVGGKIPENRVDRMSIPDWICLHQARFEPYNELPIIATNCSQADFDSQIVEMPTPPPEC